MNYLEMLKAERRYHFPPFATISDFKRRPNPDKPRNWPMVGESFIRDETSKVRQPLEDALDARPEYSRRLRQLLAANVRKGTKDQGVVVFPLGDITVQVERRDESLRIVTSKTEDILGIIQRERRWLGGNMGRSFETLMVGIWLPERVYRGDWSIIEFINLNQGSGTSEIGLEYMGPAIYKIPKGYQIRIGEQELKGSEKIRYLVENYRLAQKNTTAGRDGILDFARRLKLGNLELPTTPPAVG